MATDTPATEPALATPIGYTIAENILGKNYVGDDDGELFFDSSMEALAFLTAEGLTPEELNVPGSSVHVVALVPVHSFDTGSEASE